MKKNMKRCISIASATVGYAIILGAIYATAIAYMYSNAKRDHSDTPKTKWKDNVTGMYH